MEPPEIFSDEWLAAASQSLDQSLDLGEPCTLQVTVTSGPSGDVPILWRVGEETSSAQVEKSENVDASFLVGWNDAVAIARGDLRPAVAYMQGRLKAAGDMRLILRLLEASTAADQRRR